MKRTDKFRTQNGKLESPAEKRHPDLKTLTYPTVARIGIIGCGYWGPNLLRNFSQMPDARVVMVSDLFQPKLA